jgi:hypothetical protein
MRRRKRFQVLLERTFSIQFAATSRPLPATRSPDRLVIGDPCTPLPVCDRVRKIGLLFLCCIRNYDPKTAAQGSAPTAGSRGRYQTTRKAYAWQVKISLVDYLRSFELDSASEQMELM